MHATDKELQAQVENYSKERHMDPVQLKKTNYIINSTYYITSRQSGFSLHAMVSGGAGRFSCSCHFCRWNLLTNVKFNGILHFLAATLLSDFDMCTVCSICRSDSCKNVFQPHNWPRCTG